MRRLAGLLLALTLPLAVLIAEPLAAQGTGRLVGRIIDADQGGSIAGAVVEVVGTSLRAQSAIDGRYTILDVPAGAVSIRVRYIGYQPKVVEGIGVTAGTTTVQDVSLAQQVVELEEISVSAAAEQGTVARALDEQRYAPNVVSAITQEQISKSPDSDAGQAVQRVSGVTVQDGKFVFVRGLGERYTTTSLNGARVPSPEPEKKVVPLDLFPAGLLDGITTSKTFTPDQPGDFSGAVVNLRTREFPAQRVITVTTGMSLNTEVMGATIAKAPTEGQEWIGQGGDARTMPAELQAAGDLTGSTSGEVNSYIASLRDVWSSERETGGPGGSFGLSVGGEDPIFGQPIGYVASYSYGLSQEIRQDEERALATTGGPINQYSGSTARGSVLWGGLINLSTRIGATTKLQFNTTYTRSADNEAISLHGVNEEFSQLGELAITRLTYTERSVASFQLLGEHLFGNRHFIEWRANTARTTRDEPDRSDLVYTASVDPNSGKVTPRDWADVKQSATRAWSEVDEKNFDGAASYRLSLGAPGNPLNLTVGGAYRATDRDADSRAYDLRNLNLTQAEMAAPPEQLFGSTNALNGRLLMQANANAGRYTATDHVGAAFLQADLPIGNRVQLIAGARVEQWNLDLTSTDYLGQSAPITRANTDVLPALAVNVRLTGDQTLRLSATQTLSRPEYRELSPVPSFDILGGLLTYGNPNLQRALIQNYDVRWEWYPRAGEALSVGAFAKQFDQPIEKVIVAQTGASALSYVNAEGASNFGVELELRKRLDFVDAALRGFTLFTNATLMTSDITPGNDSISSLTNASRPMVGQSGYIVNAGLGWISPGGGWSVTALYNVAGRRIAEAGQEPLPDTYEEERHVVDLSLQAPLFTTLTLKADARNILDAPHEFTQGDVVRHRYYSGRIFGVSLQWRP